MQRCQGNAAEGWLLLRSFPWLPSDLQIKGRSPASLQGRFISDASSEAKKSLHFPQGWSELSARYAKPPHATGLCSWHPHAPPKSVKIQFILIVSHTYVSPLAVCSPSLELSATLLYAPLLEAVLLFDCVFHLSLHRKLPQARHCLPVAVRFLASPTEQVLCVESTWKSHRACTPVMRASLSVCTYYVPAALMCELVTLTQASPVPTAQMWAQAQDD